MKPPFKILFSNDTTNIETCVSPYHKKGESFRPEMLEATVDETASTGVEAHMLQPGLGWIPWWKSKVYPAEEHYSWFKQKTGLELDGFGQYMLSGGDMVGVFVNRCREKGLVPFISLRLNDGHHLEQVNTKNQMSIWVSRFYEQHPEYRIGPNPGDWNQHVHNWAIPEVREHKFAFIKEICENYHIDGFELDFMRHISYFQIDKTTKEKRTRIMTEFVAKVRQLLDQTAKSEQHRWLCVRIPAYLAAHDSLGIDLPTFIKAGVDMVNLSTFYFTEQQTDFAKIKKMIPDTAVYVEMCHTMRVGPPVEKGYDDFTFRRTTPIQYYTTAHLAYSRGLDGVSTFNFVYYREHGTSGRGPFNEPPFHVFKHLGDPDWLAQQPKHYFLSEVWNEPHVPERQLPKEGRPGQTVTFRLDMVPPKGGWKNDGKLRIQTKERLETSHWCARMNGVELALTDDVSEPYKNPYPPLLGTPGQHRAWIVPPELPKNGINIIEISILEGQPAELVFLDLAIK